MFLAIRKICVRGEGEKGGGRRREEKMREEKMREEKMREEKMREEKMREEKMREEKMREEKMREEKMREGASKKGEVRCEEGDYLDIMYSTRTKTLTRCIEFCDDGKRCVGLVAIEKGSLSHTHPSS